ncbi:hypothetical protein pb186bvf_003735 [Paramecium bursaria]
MERDGVLQVSASVLFLISISIPIVFLSIFIQRKFNQFSNPFIQFNGKVFQALYISQTWILNYPISYVIILMFNQNIFFVIFSLIAFILSTLLNSLVPFLMNNGFQKKDYLSCDNAKGMIQFHIYRLALALLNTMKWNDYQIIILIIQFLLTLALIQLLSNAPFLLCQNDQLFISLLILLGSLYLGCAIHEVTRLLYGDFGNESLLYIMVVFFLTLPVQIQIRSREVDQLIQEAQNINQLKRKIQIMHYFFRDTASQQQKISIFTGLIIQHLINRCNKKNQRFIQVNCFCNASILFYSKKQCDYRTNEQSLFHNISVFSKYVKKAWIQELLRKQHDQDTIFYYSQFLFYKYRLISQSLFELKKIQQNNPYIQFEIIYFQTNLQQYYKSRNFNSYEQKMQFDQVIHLESTITDIQLLISQILSQNGQFWKIFLRQSVYEDDILSYFEDINNKIMKCQKLWKILTQNKFIMNDHLQNEFHLKRRNRWVFQYCWYMVFILNKKLKQQLLDLLPSTKIDNIKDDQVTDDSEDEQDFGNNDNKPFGANTAIIHTNSEFNLKVLKVNNFFEDMFGYKISEIQNEPIAKILPQIMIKNHENSVKQFHNKGQQFCTFRKRLVFGQNKQGNLEQFTKYLKYIVTYQNQLEFICMLRPIQTNSNFIILNFDWELESCSQQLSDIKLIKRLPFVLLCPKLLQYSKYQNFMQMADLDVFELNYNKSSKVIIGEDGFTQIKKRETGLESEHDPNSLIFKTIHVQEQTHPTSEAQTPDDSPVIITNALMEDQTIMSVRLGEVHRLVEANHVTLRLRYPKKLEQMMNSYYSAKDDLQNLKIPAIDQNIIQRDQKGRLQINKSRLFNQIKLLSESKRMKMLDKLRFIFFRYLRRKSTLKSVIKLDVNIQFTHLRCFNKYIIIRVNKMEVHDSSKSSQFYHATYFQSQTVLKKDPSIVQIPQQVNQSLQQSIQLEFDTNRSNINKSLITDMQIFQDTQQVKQISLNTDDNIFIKYDNNKPQKSLSNLRIFKIINRWYIFMLLIFLIVLYVEGFNLQIQPNIENYGVSQMNQLIQIMGSIANVYDAALDISLFNANITQQYQLDSNMSPYSNREEFYAEKSKLIENCYNYLYEVYSSTNFVQVFYSESVNYNETQNSIDVFDQFQNNMVLLYIQDKTLYQLSDVTMTFFRYQIIPAIYYSFIYTLNHILDNIFYKLDQGILYHYYFLIIGLLTSFTCLIFSMFVLIKIQNKITSVFEQCNFIQKQNVNEIIEYQLNQELNFQQFINQSSSPRLIEDSYVKFRSEQQMRDINIKQIKSPNYQVSKTWRRKIIKNIFLYGFLFMLVIFVPFLYNIYILLKLQQLEYYLRDNSFIKNQNQYLIITAVKELYLYNSSPSNIQKDIFQQFLQEFVDQNKDPDGKIYKSSIGQIDELFNENICENDGYCSVLLDGALTRGIKNYNLVLLNLVQGILYNDTRFQTINFQSIQPHDTLQIYIQTAYQHAWNIWSQQFSDIATFLQTAEFTLMIISIFNLIIFYILLEQVLFKKLNQEYVKSRIFYKRYIPNEIVNGHKIIRVALVRCGIIKK